MGIKELISKVKQKKELAGLEDFFVQEVIESKIKNLPDSKKGEKQAVKEVRAILRRYVGRFMNPKDRARLLESGKMEAVLSTHSSTKERMPYYEQLKGIILKLNPKSILDLGCGLNPIAIATPDVKYYAYDINEQDIKLVNLFFSKYNLKGKAYVQDIRKIESWPKADLCLILKVFDVLEHNGHKLAEKILKSLECRHIIASFSTKTLSGRPMNHPQRGWIERLCTRLGYAFSLVKTKNELFYIIEK